MSTAFSTRIDCGWRWSIRDAADLPSSMAVYRSQYGGAVTLAILNAITQDDDGDANIYRRISEYFHAALLDGGSKAQLTVPEPDNHSDDSEKANNKTH